MADPVNGENDEPASASTEAEKDSPVPPAAEVVQVEDVDDDSDAASSTANVTSENNQGEPIKPTATTAADAPISDVDMSVLEETPLEAQVELAPVEFSPSPTAAAETAAAGLEFVDQESVQTEESGDDDSVSTESSEDSSGSSGSTGSSSSSSSGSSSGSSSSSSSEDPSVIGGINTQDIIYEEESEEDELDEEPLGHHANFTIDDDDEDEEDARDAILLKEDVHPNHIEQQSPLYEDIENQRNYPSPSQKMMQNRAMVRKMILQQLKGRRTWNKRGTRNHRRRSTTARDIPLHWDEEAGPLPRGYRGWTHRNKRRRLGYAMLSALIFMLGVTLLIYGVVRQRQYKSRMNETSMDDYYYDDDEYYYGDDEFDYDDFFGQSATGGSGSLQSPSSNNLPSTNPPAVESGDELLELLKLAYKSAFHSFAPTTEILSEIDAVETELLNTSVQSRKEAADQSIQWRAYLSLFQREDIIDRTTDELIMDEERILQLYSLTCFFFNFNFAQELDDECQWTGIKCDDVYSDLHKDVMYPSSDDLRVVSITLPNESLTGTLPVELIFLSHLETIDLSNNLISGSLPKYFTEDQLDSLKVLSLHDNRFEGLIPEQISKLKNLQKLTLQHNELVGEVTNEICDLRDKKLHFLWVDCSVMPNTGIPKVPCPADCCTICFEGYDHDGGPSTGGSSPTSKVDTPHIVVGDWSAEVKEKLSGLSSDGGMALMDINSPQFHAYSWLVEDSNGKDYSDERLYQRYALATLYYATNGVQWTNNEGWVTSANECDQWFGISGCDEETESVNPVIVSIELPGNNLYGSLPTEFFEHFSDLIVLTLSDNHLTGPIPSSVGSLSNLNVLELSENKLTSHIPSEIGLLKKLDHLFLQTNNLEGQMPNEICSLRTDHSFGLSLLWTDCNGFPPRVQCKKTCCTTCFTNPRNPGDDAETDAPTTHADPNRDILSTLKKMSPDDGASLDDTSSSQYKAYTWLSGSNYTSLTDIILLQRYALATLHFSAAGSGWKEDMFWLSDKTECPNEFENWIGVRKCDGGGMVTHLELPSNRLVGTLPPELSHLRMLQVLDLSDNQLYGTIPTQFGQFQELEVLQLSGNFFTGSIPDDLGFVFTMQELYLHQNLFSGSVPNSICDLKDPLGGIEVLWADCSGEPPAVTCREYCCTECFTNTSEYIASTSTEETYHFPTFMPTDSSQMQDNAIVEDPDLKSFLLEHMDGFEDSLSDASLPAYRAYLSIANADNYNDLDAFNILQRFGLITLYLSTTPDFDWKVSTGWTTKKHECTWFGISCSDNNTVSEISLPNNRLGGTLPHELALAGIGEKIVYLDFSGNNIGGKIVSEIGTFKNLAFLDLRANDFTGQIPTQLGHLPKLGSLQLHANELTGAMPQEVCLLRSDKLQMLVADCDPDKELDEVTCEQPSCCTRCY